HQEVTEPPPEDAAVQRDTLTHLLLATDRELPAIGPLAPPVPGLVLYREVRSQRVVVEVRLNAHRGIAGVNLPQRATERGTLCRRIREIAVRYEVPVVVDPGPGGGELDVIARLARQASDDQRLAEHVLGVVDLECGLSIAKDIPRRSELGCPVLVARGVESRNVVVSIGRQERRSKVILGVRGVEPVEPESRADGHPIDGPLVLYENAALAVHLVLGGSRTVRLNR